MSTVTVICKPDVLPLVQSHQEQITASIIKTSSSVLGKAQKEVIVGYGVWKELVPVNAPDILIRGETSVSHRHLIQTWAEVLVQSCRSIIQAEEIRIAAKTYVLDSEWVE